MLTIYENVVLLKSTNEDLKTDLSGALLISDKSGLELFIAYRNIF